LPEKASETQGGGLPKAQADPGKSEAHLFVACAALLRAKHFHFVLQADQLFHVFKASDPRHGKIPGPQFIHLMLQLRLLSQQELVRQKAMTWRRARRGRVHGRRAPYLFLLLQDAHLILQLGAFKL
jgi:hypothetical protein